MRRLGLAGGIALLPVGWIAAAGGFGMVGHMAGHMIAVAVAAPLLAIGLRGTAGDPARRWPAIVTPLAMSVVELVVVWGWHLPALRRLADAAPALLALEQVMFATAGLLLWSAVLAAGQRMAGVGALLLTSMHMTLLGALIGLAPRPLYAMHGAHALGPLEDQQLGGVVMLMVGAANYFIGGLAILAGLLSMRREAA
ncbi:cytochrome c oxidase assembly protein [Sphingomonas solaris]|uniref:Cytochrome c oxidase assembly protein n=1 Tax=Alterirhizorhabdus solaris TaxID=2529389 RepID=A0A558R7J7_9SPHN|nr:cytochrome c oxidase assembly protein [Sphingomonas solaris]TVV75369.1 cytochrome c oxidase assembly protein [Sphingomonas solaris]